MSKIQHATPQRLRRALLIRWLALWPITIGLFLYPINNRVLRIAILGLVVLLWIGAVWLSWRVKWLRSICIGLPILAGIFALLPGHTIDQSGLRERYPANLRAFEGSRYQWGGENRLGIDCSGLVRAALMNACLQESLRTLNPSLLRFSISCWWNDCSARALGEEYRHTTVKLFAAESVNSIPLTQILPGDMAVTDDGIHVLAYLGANEWIEADPNERKVIIEAIPSTNIWFDGPVTVVRWSLLNPKP